MCSRPSRVRGREVVQFEFDKAILDTPVFARVPLDPRLGFHEGRQHPAQARDTFGLFADASPDRWGRLLMQRRLERDQRAGRVEPGRRLYESDYLLGVHDARIAVPAPRTAQAAAQASGEDRAPTPPRTPIASACRGILSAEPAGLPRDEAMEAARIAPVPDHSSRKTAAAISVGRIAPANSQSGDTAPPKKRPSSA